MSDERINYSSKTLRAIATNGLPLKIQVEWTDNDYWERRHPDTDDLTCINVAGWQVRINGKKYPRGNWGDDGPDWTYRYTPGQGQTEAGRRIAIDRALGEARLEIC
mgnify:FL=1